MIASRAIRDGDLRRVIVALRGDLTCKEFAGRLGETLDEVSRIEHAHRALSLPRAIKWAQALGLPIATFMLPSVNDAIDAACEFSGVERIRLVQEG